MKSCPILRNLSLSVLVAAVFTSVSAADSKSADEWQFEGDVYLWGASIDAKPDGGSNVHITIGMRGQASTIAAALKDQGYATGQFGKNHLDDNNKHHESKVCRFVSAVRPRTRDGKRGIQLPQSA
jgi:hypothetical protein